MQYRIEFNLDTLMYDVIQIKSGAFINHYEFEKDALESIQ